MTDGERGNGRGAGSARRLRQPLTVAIALAHRGGQRAAGQAAMGRAPAAHVPAPGAARRRALDDRLVHRQYCGEGKKRNEHSINLNYKLASPPIES